MVNEVGNFLDGLFEPVAAVYITVKGELYKERESRFWGAGILTSYALTIVATVSLTYAIPWAYRKIQNTINKTNLP